MLPSNITSTHPATFLLVGIPGLEHLHVWISIPFCFAYTLALLGNCTLLFIIRADAALHEPLYLFLAMLATIDLVLASTTLPKMLAIFWFRGSGSIRLLLLAGHGPFDRYVAICPATAYTTSPDLGSLITKIGMAVVVRAVTLMTPLPFLRPVIAIGLLRWRVADTSFNNIYGIAWWPWFIAGAWTFVILSYVFILQAVLQLASQQARYKAFGTCVSHIGAILSTYTPVVISSVMYRVACRAAPHVHILLAIFYLLFPPMINPIIYGVKTK
uniref:Olfactory receptor family 52 subfamily K member 1 n=1 Tax=Rhinopithecus bieti TaxID=61621 RepID=A0A2K6MIJ6_RHIBE